jgi:hypothetical protein
LFSRSASSASINMCRAPANRRGMNRVLRYLSQRLGDAPSGAAASTTSGAECIRSTHRASRTLRLGSVTARRWVNTASNAEIQAPLTYSGSAEVTWLRMLQTLLAIPSARFTFNPTRSRTPEITPTGPRTVPGLLLAYQ